MEFAVFKLIFAFPVVAFFACAAATAAHADGVPSPSGDVILTITGTPELANVGGTLQFDHETLAQLGLETVETSTIWTEGVQTFEGVSLAALVGLIGADDGTLRATAINDYVVEIPVTDAVDGGPILAMHLNGKEMSVRDKGPLWVIYPYDASADYRTEVIYSRSIWQLDRIEVVE